MTATKAQTPGRPAVDPAAALPLRLLLRFADPAREQRFIDHYVDFYFRHAQVSLLLGVVLVLGDWGVDRIAQGVSAANHLRLTLAVPVLLGGLAYSLLPQARRHWQPVMAAFIVAVALCLFFMLVRLDAEGGNGLKSWVGVLNFTFLQFYCFVILGVQFRHALASGAAILLAFEYALGLHAGLSSPQAAYWTYHVVTVFVLAAAVGWWREFLLRNEFIARTALDDSRAAAERRAQQLEHYDDATGLPNRRLFAALAVPALEQSRRNGKGCVVLHADVHRLGVLNDAFGRGHGDVVLADIARRLRACIRGSDLAAVGPAADEPGIVARLGDSTFTMLLADVGTQERASLVAQRLLASVAQPVTVLGVSPSGTVVLSASIGIAMYPGDATDLAGLSRCAEQAARVAREAGGNQHRFFDEALNSRARERLVLEAELRHAIQAGHLCLHYQPKVDVRSGALLGAEALVRWQHPQRGLVPPGVFIGLAEDSGLIVPLTDWVLHCACASLRRWSQAGLDAPPLSVNLPAASLADPRLPDRLEDLLRHYELHPSSLVLELTETMLMRDVAAALDVLGRLRERGFKLSLDDFGTGYSSLSYLRQLPMTELKIDRSFVSDVTRGGRDAALVIAIITLARELGMQVVAEGVETPEQSDFLRERGCHVQQGFLFSRPVPQPVFESLLKPTRAPAQQGLATA